MLKHVMRAAGLMLAALATPAASQVPAAPAALEAMDAALRSGAFKRVTSVLIGVSKVEQLAGNIAVAQAPPLTAEELAKIDQILDR